METYILIIWIQFLEHRTRSTTVEMRRKLDDSQAALHELGRENQSIQVSEITQFYHIIH